MCTSTALCHPSSSIRCWMGVYSCSWRGPALQWSCFAGFIQIVTGYNNCLLLVVSQILPNYRTQKRYRGDTPNSIATRGSAPVGRNFSFVYFIFLVPIHHFILKTYTLLIITVINSLQTILPRILSLFRVRVRLPSVFLPCKDSHSSHGHDTRSEPCTKDSLHCVEREESHFTCPCFWHSMQLEGDRGMIDAMVLPVIQLWFVCGADV